MEYGILGNSVAFVALSKAVAPCWSRQLKCTASDYRIS
jgi:hypothetical protein